MAGNFRGPASILFSALLFYLATFFVKLGHPETLPESLIYLAARFWLGYFFILIWFRFFKKIRIGDIKIVNKKWLWHRAIWNLVAVIFFYLSVIYGTLTGANILNMTYPVFVALFSASLLNEKMHFMAWIGIAFTIVGSVFVSLHGSTYTVTYGDFFGILSGITAGLAIVALRKIRLTDSTEAALLYNFRLGFWIMAIPVGFFIYKVPVEKYSKDLFYPALSALSGIMGQVALTYGFKYVSAVQGSILSASRLVFAVILGWVFFQTEITFFSISGAVMILAANIALSWRKGMVIPGFRKIKTHGQS